jgi:DhnA family fructose-bisphosphate aldolase class Ia
MQSMFDTGRLRHRLRVILPVDQGIEHSPAPRSPPNPATSIPETS